MQLWLPVASAEDSHQVLLENDPIAEAAVQKLPAVAPSQPMLASSTLIYGQVPTENPLDLYVHTQDEEWSIPQHVDRKDPWVRLLLLLPSRPIVLHVAVELEGQPYRAARENWIDDLIAHVQNDSLIREGAAVAEAVLESQAEDKNVPAEAVSDVRQETESDLSPVKTEEAELEAKEEGVEEAKEEKEEKVPMVAARGRQERTVLQRLINYLGADQVQGDREEVRWLLAEWTGGPALLALGPASSWQRADKAPLWKALDQDGDDILSASEITAADNLMKLADQNEDEVVDLEELNRLADDHSRTSDSKSHPLLVVLEDNTDWETLLRTLQKLYGSAANPREATAATFKTPILERICRGDRSLIPADLSSLLYSTPEVACHVVFSSQAGKLKLLALDESAEPTPRYVSSESDVITVALGSTRLELSAADGAEADQGTMAQTQIAVGAVDDGYPLFRLLDGDNNSRLTIRECRRLGKRLHEFDRDQNGQIERIEVPNAVRIAVTRGPRVHEFLRQRSAAAHDGMLPQAAEAPTWFVGMDRNKDGDISRREFQGSSETFVQLDKNGDGLISSQEAQ